MNQSRLNDLIELARKDAKGKSPEFHLSAIVFLADTLDKALQDKAQLAHSLDITQTRLNNLAEKCEKLVAVYNEHLKGN